VVTAAAQPFPLIEPVVYVMHMPAGILTCETFVSMCGLCSDYRHMPQLDAYDPEGLDDEAEGEEVSEGAAQAARLAAEMELDRRDRHERTHLPGAFDGVPSCSAHTPSCFTTLVV
jgi:hypothetical protein